MSENYNELLDKVETLHDIVSASILGSNRGKKRECLTNDQAARIGRELVNYLKFKQEDWFIVNVSAPGWEHIEDIPAEEYRIDITMFPLDFDDKEKVFDSLREEKDEKNM